MIWFAIIIAIVFGGIVGLFKQSLLQGVRAGLIALVLGIIASILIVYSGVLGG